MSAKQELVVLSKKVTDAESKSEANMEKRKVLDQDLAAAIVELKKHRDEAYCRV